MTVTPGRPSSGRTQGPVTDERQRSLAEPLEGVREPDDVLPLDQRADAEKGGRRAGCALEQPEPLQVDAAVDDLRLRGGVGDRRDEPPAQPLGDRDHRRCALHHPPRRRTDEWILDQVRDVLPVRGDDERSPRGESGEEPGEAGREEEMGVDDVRPEPPRRADRTGSELRVTQLAAAAPVEHDPLDVVPARGQLPLQPLDEHAEIRRRCGRVHLRDEQDAHRRII